MIAFVAGRRHDEHSLPRFQRLTYARGSVGSARFSADGQSVVYAARWGERDWDLVRQRLDSPLPLPYQLRGARPVATEGADVAVLLDKGDGRSVLARVPLEGGPPRELLDGVTSADWSPGGKDLAIVREVGGDARRLEYPVGRVLVEATGVHRLGLVRVGPGGDRLAAVDLPNGATDPEGSVILVDRSGRARTLSGPWKSVGGLAWSPRGNEVWFSAANTTAGGNQALHAVDLSGHERSLFTSPGGLDLQDVRPDGRALVRQRQWRLEVRGRLRGDTTERDLSLTNWNVAPSLLPDGSAVGILTIDEAGGPGAYLWRAGDTVPVRLADCGLHSLSPDGLRVLCGEGDVGKPREFRVVPTGAGETRTLPRGSIDRYQWGFWCPDNRRVIFTGSEAGRPRRLFIQDTDAGPPRPLTPEGIAFDNVRMTGEHVLSRRQGDPSDPWRLYPLAGGEPKSMPWLRPSDFPICWSADKRLLFLLESLAFPLRVKRLDLRTGSREPRLELRPPYDSAAPTAIGMELTPDGAYYAYTYAREPGELFLVEGLR